jgi:putative glycosyltransferase (TIGR04372 family)
MVIRRNEVLATYFSSDRPYVVVTTKEPAGTTDPLRSRSVTDLLPAIELLCDRGYHVLRVVDSSNDDLPVTRTGVVDFHVRRDGEPGDEIALVSGAEFVISTTTGLDALALSLRVPVLYIDAARLWYAFLGTSLATFFPPRYRDIATNSEIGLTDLLSRGIAVTKDSDAFTRAGVRVEVSSPESIRDYVDSYEALRLFGRTERIFESVSPQQARWRQSLLRHHRDVISLEHGDIHAVLHPRTLDPAVSVYVINT